MSTAGAHADHRAPSAGRVVPPPDDPLLLACREVGRAMDRFDDAACAALGVGRTDLRALNLLEQGPLAPAVMAEQLGLSRGAVTALVDRLVAAGFVAREPDPDDRRSVRVALQPTTFRAFAAVYRPLGLRVHAATDPLDDAGRAHVVTTLEAMASAFDEAVAHLRGAGG